MSLRKAAEEAVKADEELKLFFTQTHHNPDDAGGLMALSVACDDSIEALRAALAEDDGECKKPDNYFCVYRTDGADG